MWHKFKKIINGWWKWLILLIIPIAFAAPIIPGGNGLISVAVFRDSADEIVYLQISDEQYALMGSLPGIAHNPQDHNGLKYTGRSYQYPVETYKAERIITSVTTTDVVIKNPQPEFADTDFRQSLFNVLTPEAEAAIARDTFLARISSTGTSQTEAMTITGSDTVLLVFVEHSTSQTTDTVTYAGTSLTQVDTITAYASTVVDSWILVGTATGANNIVANFSASVESNLTAESYTGVGSGGSTGGSDAHNTANFTASAADQSIETTTVADNAWIPIYFRASGGGYSAGTNVSIQDNVANIALMGDTNAAITPAAATTQIHTRDTGTNDGGILTVSIAPVSARNRIIIFD